MRTLLLILASLLGPFVAGSCQCAPTGLPAGSDCEDAQQCEGELVCDPSTDRCGLVDCAEGEPCGNGAVCDEAGRCVDNVAGGYCEEDVDCVAGERCRSDRTCTEAGQPGDPCGSAEDCGGGLVCPVATSVCTEDVACSSHDDCGAAAYCASGTCAPAGDTTACSEDRHCLADGRCVGVVCVPDTCEGDAYAAEVIPANVLISIDRSGSMRSSVGNNGPSKWDVARDAVSELLAAHQGDIRFGLNLFPGFDQGCDDGESCGPGAINIDVGDDKGAEIDGFLDDADTCSYGTPTAENLSMVTDYEGLQDQGRSNYLLLISDGESTCEDPVPLAGQLLAASPSVKTFVVGFGAGVDPQELSDLAEAGGTARNANPVYYQADDAVSLQAALDDIAGSVLSCDYQIPTTPADPDTLSVFMNGQRVARDDSGAAGWNYDPQLGRLSFSGNACVALRSGAVTDLTIVYGCPLPDVEPGPDAGPPGDGGPPPDGGEGCSDRCENGCGSEACLLPEGQCGPCAEDADCCPGSLCLVESGQCLPVGG